LGKERPSPHPTQRNRFREIHTTSFGIFCNLPRGEKLTKEFLTSFPTGFFQEGRGEPFSSPEEKGSPQKNKEVLSL